MKTLFLIRHARAADQQESLTDFERPLTSTGQKESAKMAEWMASTGIKPDLIISSPASRALETAHIFADMLDYPIQKVIIDRILYESVESEQYLDIIRQIDPAVGLALIIGHNPGLLELARFLDNTFALELPKAGVIGLEFKTDWAEIRPATGQTRFFNYPDNKERGANPDSDVQAALEDRIYASLYSIFAEVNSDALKSFERKLRRTSAKLSRRFLEQGIGNSLKRLGRPE